VVERAGNERVNGVELGRGDGHWPLRRAHEIDHSRDSQNREPSCKIQADEAVAGKERELDFLLPVLPATQALPKGQERLTPALHQCPVHPLFVPGTGADRVPAGPRCSKKRLVWRSVCLTRARRDRYHHWAL